MTDPTLTIVIDRSGLPGSLSPLTLAADDSQPLGILDYTEPARQARITYMPDSRDMHGSIAIASSWQQALMDLTVHAKASSETAMRALVDELRDALGQFSYTVTVTSNGASSEVWACDMGSLSTEPRAYEDLRDFETVGTVVIPCYPIPGA